MYTHPLLWVLVIHEWWITLQHLNIWLNPWVQKLDRTYGLGLVRKNQHPVITLVLGEYWTREMVTMLLCSFWVSSGWLQSLLVVNLVYHLAKLSSLVQDGITKSSTLFGSVYTLLAPFTYTSRLNITHALVRLGLQGFDALVHVGMAYTLATQTGWYLPVATVLVWLYHQATVYWTGQSTATRPVERARQVCPPSENPHTDGFDTDGETLRLLRPLDAETPVDTVLLGHPVTIVAPVWGLAQSLETSRDVPAPGSGWRRVVFQVFCLLCALHSMVVQVFWTEPIVCDRFQIQNGVWVETWLVPAFGYQYRLFPRACERKLKHALERARDRGASRVILGAMNKAATIGDGGRAFASLFDPERLQLDDGNLLTAAVLNHHIKAHIGTATRFRLVGATSKIGTAIVQYWASRGLVVECVSSSQERLRRLCESLPDGHTPIRALGPGDVEPLAPPVLWVFCRGGHYDVHPESIVLTVAIPAPTFRRQPRRRIDAGRVVYSGQSPFNWHLGLDPKEMYPCLATGTLPPFVTGIQHQHILGPIDYTRLLRTLLNRIELDIHIPRTCLIRSKMSGFILSGITKPEM